MRPIVCLAGAAKLQSAFLLLLCATRLCAQTNLTEKSPEQLKKLSLEELMNLDVTSVARRAEPLRQAPSAIQVVTGDDIRRTGASSIPEALRLADNLEVAQKNSHDWGISARGFNTDLANKLLVLIDGRTVYTPLFSGVFWGAQDYLLEDIDRIEVISGPGGTLWGANAVNGVINITTKSAKDTQGFFLETGGGSSLQDFAGMRYGSTLASNVYLRVYGKYQDRASEDLLNGKNAGDDWRMGQGGFRIDAERSDQNKLTLQGDLYDSDENDLTRKVSKMSGGNLLGRWIHTISEESDTSLQLYYDHTHLGSPKPKVLLEPAGNLKDDLDTYDLDFQHRFGLGEHHQFVWGFGYRFTHDSLQNAPSVAFLPPQLDHNLFSAFVQDEIRLATNLSLTLGTKVEHNDYTGFELEPSGRLQWNVTQKHMLWSAVSRAVRTPSRIDRDLREPTGLPGPLPNSILSGGGPNYVSETVIAYEAGYRAQVATNVSASVSLFYNDYDHVRSTTITLPFIFPLVFHNNLEGRTYGLELSATWQVLDWWRLHVGYDLLKEDLRVKPGQVDASHTLNETADPQQQFSFRSSMDLSAQVELDAGLRWVDTLHNNNLATPGTVPSYFEMDARLGWHPSKSLEFSLVGQNLLHSQHPEYGFPTASREGIERSVYGKVTLRF